MKILNKKEIGEIEGLIRDVYGAEDCLKNFVVLKTGKEEKIWVASKKIFELELEALRINSIGFYFGRIDRGKLRMSIEGAGIVGPKAKKNIAELDENSIWDYIRGFDVTPSSLKNTEENSYVLVKYEKSWIGVAKLADEQLFNVLPKSRKIISLSK